MQHATLEEAMDLALGQARLAGDAGEVPVGAVLLEPDGAVVASDRNRTEERSDPTAHAEILVIRAAASAAGSWHLDGHTLVVTLEPCAMCAMAAVWARLRTIAYGAADPKAGAAWSLFNVPQDKRLNHYIELVARIREHEAAVLLSQFFEERR